MHPNLMEINIFIKLFIFLIYIFIIILIYQYYQIYDVVDDIKKWGGQRYYVPPTSESGGDKYLPPPIPLPPGWEQNKNGKEAM